MNEPSGDVASTPYVGLVPYGENDADFFFGRDDDRWVVAGNLRGYRLTILYGPSGVGKTSLLYAGVVPDLRRRPVAGAPSRGGRQPVAVCTFRAWQDEPLPPLMNRLREAAAEALGGAELPPWQRGDSAVEALRAWTQGLQALLVVLDQFEDYFLYHADDEDRGSFAHEFPALLNEPRLRVNFLVSIREDAWAKLDRFEGRVPHLFGNYVRVGHLSRPAAREAIQRPIEEWNRRLPHGERPYTIEPALVEAVVDAGASGGLALGESGTGVDPAESNATEVNAAEVITLLQQVLAALLVALSNAATLRDETLFSTGAERLLDRVRSRSPVLTADRRLDHDLRHLTQAIDAGWVCTDSPPPRQR